MERYVTNIVQWAIAALSGVLLVAAAHAQTSSATPAEGLTAAAESEYLAHAAAGSHKIRVGVAPVAAPMTAETSGANFSEPLRGLLMSQLTGAVEVMPLSGIALGQVEADAQLKECDYVLYTAITRQAKSSGKAGFVRGASQMTQVIPLVGPRRGMGVAMTSVTAGTVLSGAGEAARVVRARDEISLAYRLIPVQTAGSVLGDALHVRANEDGQDVITPLVEQEAAAVLNRIRQEAAVH